MGAPPESGFRLGLVGTGAQLVKAIESLKELPAVRIAVVADASDRSEGGKLARTLQLPVVRNPMEVFRSDANIVLEVNGDERQYERLLSIKPPGVEVMSVRGTRLLIDLFQKAEPAAGAPGPREAPADSGGAPTPQRLEPLAAALRAALRHVGAPEEAARTLLPAVAAVAGMDVAGLARASATGFTWLFPTGEGEALARLPADQLRDAMGRTEPLWLAKPPRGFGAVGLVPLRVGTDVTGVLAVARTRDGAAGAEDQQALLVGADILISAFRATQPAPSPEATVREVPVEVVREVVKEIPVEVVREVVREVPVEVVREVVREVPVEVIKEVIREVPVEVVREVVREVTVEVPVVQEVVREIVREIDVPVEVSREVIREVPVEVIKEVVREVPVEVVREVVREVPVEVIKEVVRDVPVEVIKEVVREVPVEVVREVVREVPVEIIKEVVRDVPVEVIREVPVEVVREVVREVPVEVIKEVVREVPVEVPGGGVDQESLFRLRRRVEELETAQEQMASLSGRVPVGEKMQALLNMAGGVGHVFNNVLAGILGRTQLLLKRTTRDKSKELQSGLHEIEAATRTGIDALTRIQEFSRTRPSEPFAAVDLNDVVQRAVEQTRPRWRDEPAARGVRIELITHFGPHSQVIGAESELLDAVVQLITNAVEAMPRGGTLTIRTGLDSGRGVITVSDTGVGMAEAVKRRAFEPFFSTKGETGLGLGLSMVYGVMARHGGEATLESEEGHGTTVALHIPTSGDRAPVETVVPETERSQVLLVDDDETLRTAVGDMLRGASYAVTLAGSGLEGVAKVRERDRAFDLVITDLGMPDVPGWEVVEAVKQVDAGTPVVIMSGFDRARATRRAKELGVDLVISKPFDIQEFLTTIRGLLAGHKRP